MPRLTFNQVFLGLMALGFLSAFVVPAHYTDVGRAQLEGVFMPVSRPLYRLSTWLRGRMVNETSPDSRATQDIIQENLTLRQQNIDLRSQIAQLQSQLGERTNLGSLMDLCDRFRVTGTDSGSRDGLTLGGALLAGVQIRQPVLHDRDLIGRIDRAGAGGAHVRLITDVDFHLNGRFERFNSNGLDADYEEQTKDLKPIVNGLGGGKMVITNLPNSKVQNLIHENDWVVLQSNDWPPDAQTLRIGQVTSIGPWEKQPLLAEIKVSPQTSLMGLNDVWVMTRSRSVQ